MTFFARPQSTQVRISHPGAEDAPSPRKDTTQRQCRNIVIYGHCKYQDKGCTYHHPSPTAEREQTPSSTAIPAAAVNAPVFVPKAAALASPVASPPTSPQPVYEPESYDHYAYAQADDVVPVDDLTSIDTGYYDDTQYSYVPPYDPTGMDAWYTNPATFHRQPFQKSLDWMQRWYGPEIKSVALYLISKSSHRSNDDHLLEMIRPKIQQEMEDAMLATDRLEAELLSELENARLVRLLCKFGFINERPEFALEPRWSETGDRYIIKLFRDYVFHQVDEHGNPVVNMTHVLTCLNKLDAGSEERVMLVSRDDTSCLVVSYKEIKACMEGAFRTPGTACHAENFDTDNQLPIVNHLCHPPYATHTEQLTSISRSSVDLGTMRRQVDSQETLSRQAELAELADLALSELPELPQSPLPASNIPSACSPLHDTILPPPSPVPGEEAPAATDPSPSPFSRPCLALCATKSGDVYVYGGDGDPGTLSRYSTKDSTVTLLHCDGDSPGERLNSAMTIVGSVLVLHGGYKGSWEEMDPSLFILNLVSRKWSKITAHGDAPVHTSGHSMVAVGTTIYIYSGIQHKNGHGVTNSDMWAFHLITLHTKPTWELVKPCSDQRPLAKQSSYDRDILVPYRKGLMLIANRFLSPTGERRLEHHLGTFLWTFDLNSKCWTTLGRIAGDGPLQPQHLIPPAVVFGDVVYVVADYTPDPDKYIIKPGVFAFKISEHRWSELYYPLDLRPHKPTVFPICATTGGLKIFFCREIGDDPNRDGMIYIVDIERIVHNSSIHLAEQLTEIQRTSQVNLEEKLSQLERENEKSKHSRVVLAELRRENEKFKRDQIILANLKQENEELKRKQVIFVELEKENEELKRSRGQIISVILESLLAASLSALNLQEMDAQDVVDFLAEVLESQKFHQSRNERRRILNLLRKIVKSAQIFPKRTELSGVQCDLIHPISDEGSYGLIYQGTFEGQTAQAGELVLLAHISHQNIIPLYGAYLSAEPKPKICIVSPWMENGDLADFLRKYPNTPPIPLMCDVATGLQFLHDMGVIHSDLKARNVLVSQSRRAMLADFGVSTVVSTNVGITTVGDFAGTPHWMAPELLLSDEHPPPTEQSDMWGFGCICFEVEAGRIPFIEYHSQTALISASLKAQITPLRPKPNCAPVITKGGPLLTLAERCWNHDSSQCPTAADALQFLAELIVKDDRPSMDEEFAMYEAAKSGRDEVRIDYGRILSIIQKYKPDDTVERKTD
ncbi:PAB-dependent poly(A)-specific ribonuclease subunit PAN3 [Leucoagaricus sp. SymC.cos]|nr:PAB-dependent poly(A)-specific ribonuclease subunit PAN3 [Leucoagaricus sp. SymC.cos]